MFAAFGPGVPVLVALLLGPGPMLCITRRVVDQAVANLAVALAKKNIYKLYQTYIQVLPRYDIYKKSKINTKY